MIGSIAVNDVALVNLIFAGVLLGIWFAVHRTSYVLLWCGAYVMATVNALMNFNNDLFVPYHATYWALVSLTSIVIQALVMIGFRLRAGMTPIPIAFLVFYFFIEVATVWFTIGYEHRGLSMWFVPFCSFVTAFAVAWVLLRAPGRRPEWPDIAAAGVYGIHGLAQLASAIVALAQGATRDDALMSLYLNILWYSMPSTYAAMGLIAIVIIATDARAKSPLQTGGLQRS